MKTLQDNALTKSFDLTINSLQKFNAQTESSFKAWNDEYENIIRIRDETRRNTIQHSLEEFAKKLLFFDETEQERHEKSRKKYDEYMENLKRVNEALINNLIYVLSPNSSQKCKSLSDRIKELKTIISTLEVRKVPLNEKIFELISKFKHLPRQFELTFKLLDGKCDQIACDKVNDFVDKLEFFAYLEGSCFHKYSMLGISKTISSEEELKFAAIWKGKNELSYLVADVVPSKFKFKTRHLIASESPKEESYTLKELINGVKPIEFAKGKYVSIRMSKPENQWIPDSDFKSDICIDQMIELKTIESYIKNLPGPPPTVYQKKAWAEKTKEETEKEFLTSASRENDKDLKCFESHPTKKWLVSSKRVIKNLISLLEVLQKCSPFDDFPKWFQSPEWKATLECFADTRSHARGIPKLPPNLIKSQSDIIQSTYNVGITLQNVYTTESAQKFKECCETMAQVVRVLENLSHLQLESAYRSAVSEQCKQTDVKSLKFVEDTLLRVVDQLRLICPGPEFESSSSLLLHKISIITEIRRHRLDFCQQILLQSSNLFITSDHHPASFCSTPLKDINISTQSTSSIIISDKGGAIFSSLNNGLVDFGFLAKIEPRNIQFINYSQKSVNIDIGNIESPFILNCAREIVIRSNKKRVLSLLVDTETEPVQTNTCVPIQISQGDHKLQISLEARVGIEEVIVEAIPETVDFGVILASSAKPYKFNIESFSKCFKAAYH
jgi:hypothetical protein